MDKMDINELLLLFAIEVNKAKLLAKYIYKIRKTEINKRTRKLLKQRTAKRHFYFFPSQKTWKERENLPDDNAGSRN